MSVDVDKANALIGMYGEAITKLVKLDSDPENHQDLNRQDCIDEAEAAERHIFEA